MNKQDLNVALSKCESFTEALLLQVVGFPAPFTFVTVVSLLLGAWAIGKFL